MGTKRNIVFILGIFFFVLGLFSIAYSIYLKRYSEVIWFCYIGLVLIGLGLLFRKDKLVVAQLNILILPTIIWNIDFFYRLLTGESFWGITDYFFLEGRSIIGNIISLQHIYTIPLVIYALYLIKIKTKNAWRISVIQILLIFVISRLLTLETNNVNCVFRPCFDFALTIPYTFGWIIAYFLIILITHFGLSNINFLKA
ncbi:hypothetical protein J4408_01990 [Candidatus Pacearchaeota archaeon]|nr:hypothetical protein [Candidatus Pacearchaeota archaeon]